MSFGLSKPVIGRNALAALLLLRPLACQGADDAAAMPGIVVLANGDRIRGALAVAEKPAEIAWQSADFAAPFHFRLDEVQTIKFDLPAAKAAGAYRFDLSCGDELYGSLESVDDRELEVRTAAETLRIHRRAVSSIRRRDGHESPRPRARLLVIDKEHVLRGDGKVVYAKLTGYDCQTDQFAFQAGDETNLWNAKEIDEIALGASDSQSKRGPRWRLIYANGNRLSGERLQIDGDSLTIESPAFIEPVVLPLVGLRAIQASAARAASSPPQDEASLRLEHGRLQGRLVAASADDGQIALAWQPSGSSSSAAFRAQTKITMVFATSLVDGPTDAGEMGKVFLHNGDVVTCRIEGIDADKTIMRLGASSKHVPNGRIKAVQLRSHPDHGLSAEKLERLLTLPRIQKDDPPTHILSSLGGDYLRGRLIAVTATHVLFEVGARRRKFPRERFGCIIWLDDAAPPPDESSESHLHVTDGGGGSLRLAKCRLEKDSLVGTNGLLGECRLPLSQLREVRVGKESTSTELSQIYGAWRLSDAIEPKAFAEGAAEPAGGMSELLGRGAPDFTIDLVDGAPFRLSQQQGEVVVLDFWASWCAPCMKSLPEIAALAEEFDGQPVKFVAVNLQESRDDAANAKARWKPALPVGLDHDGRVAKQYGVGSIPQTVVIATDGTVAYVEVGHGSQSTGNLKQAIEKALAKGP